MFRRVAEHEYRVMARLTHENLLRPIDIVDGELGVGLVYPRDERFQRLDLWMAGQGDGIPVAEQLTILRQVADAVLYAHSNRVVHRALSPHAIWVRRREGDGEVRVLVGDWQTAGSAGADSLTGSSGGVTALFGAGEQPARRRARRLRAAWCPATRTPGSPRHSRRPRVPSPTGPTGSAWTSSRSARSATTSWPGTRPRRAAPTCATGCAARTAWTSPPTCRRLPHQHGT